MRRTPDAPSSSNRRTSAHSLKVGIGSVGVETVAATVTIPQEIAWRIFTKGIARDDARAQVRVTGDAALGEHVLGMLAIVG